MNVKCISVRVEDLTKRIQVSVAEICGMGLDCTPLLVDEGYLLIDFKGDISKLFVRR